MEEIKVYKMNEKVEMREAPSNSSKIGIVEGGVDTNDMMLINIDSNYIFFQKGDSWDLNGEYRLQFPYKNPVA